MNKAIITTAIQRLVNKFAGTGLKVDDDQRQRFGLYVDLIIDWNQRINLISKKDLEIIVDRHLAECLSLLTMLEFPQNATILDLGSGAGFPGIPVKIVRSDLAMTFAESNRMKSLFLKKVIAELALTNSTVECNRAEAVTFQTKYHAKFEVVLARAVAPLTSLWQWSQNLIKPDGCLLALKGGDLAKEITTLMNHFPGITIAYFSYPGLIIPVEKNRILIKVSKK